MSKKKKNPNDLFQVTVDFSTDGLSSGEYIVARGKLKQFKKSLELCGYSLDPEDGDVWISKLGDIAEITPRVYIEVDSVRL